MGCCKQAWVLKSASQEALLGDGYSLTDFFFSPFGQVVAGRPGVVGRLRNRTGGSMFWATGQEELLPNKLHAA
jgi:hypothetical protein